MNELPSLHNLCRLLQSPLEVGQNLIVWHICRPSRAPLFLALQNGFGGCEAWLQECWMWRLCLSLKASTGFYPFQKMRPDGEVPEVPTAALTVTNNSDLNDSREINFEYLKHVVLKFMSCRESEVRKTCFTDDAILTCPHPPALPSSFLPLYFAFGCESTCLR